MEQLIRMDASEFRTFTLCTELNLKWLCILLYICCTAQEKYSVKFTVKKKKKEIHRKNTVTMFPVSLDGMLVIHYWWYITNNKKEETKHSKLYGYSYFQNP